MRPSFLGAVGWLAALVAVYAVGLEWITPRKVRSALRSEHAFEEPLDETMACDLLSAHLTTSRVECRRGQLTSTNDAARFSGVRVDGREVTWCFARLGRWRPLREAYAAPCFPSAPHDESAEQARVVAWARAELEGRLRAIRAALATDARHPKRCGRERWTTVPVLERDVLSGSGLNPGWEFLSTRWLRGALEAPDDERRLLEASNEWMKASRARVVIIAGSRRELARSNSALEGNPFDFVHGHFSGTLTLIDAARGEIECEAPFSFSSSARVAPATIPVGGISIPSLDVPTEDRVKRDFRVSYRLALDRTLTEMTGSGVFAELE
ncbi:MAG: hypothetical protein ACOZQL_20910 [Myxococcota bacterium]